MGIPLPNTTRRDPLERMADALEQLAAPAELEGEIANWLSSLDPEELHKEATRRAAKTGQPVMWCVLEVLKEWAGGAN